MAGFGNNRTANAYHDRLWARGVVLDNKGKRVAIVAVDVIGYFKNEVDTIRGLVSPKVERGLRAGLEHASARGAGHDGALGRGRADAPASITAISISSTRRCADCIDDAASHLQPARVFYADRE